MKRLTDFICESYASDEYAFVKTTNKDGSDTKWWSIVKYLDKNGPSTKKEIWDGMGWTYNPATFRGLDSTMIAAMRSAGIIHYDDKTHKWSIDDMRKVKRKMGQRVKDLEKKCKELRDFKKQCEDYYKHMKSYEHFKEAEDNGYQFRFWMDDPAQHGEVLWQECTAKDAWEMYNDPELCCTIDFTLETENGKKYATFMPVGFTELGLPDKYIKRFNIRTK